MSWWDKLIGRANEASSNRRSGSNRRKPKPKQSKPKSSGGSKPKSNKPTRPTGTASHRGGTSAPVNRRRSDSSSRANRNRRIQQREQKRQTVRQAYQQNQGRNKSGTEQHRFKATVKKWDTHTTQQQKQAATQTVRDSASKLGASVRSATSEAVIKAYKPEKGTDGKIHLTPKTNALGTNVTTQQTVYGDEHKKILQSGFKYSSRHGRGNGKKTTIVSSKPSEAEIKAHETEAARQKQFREMKLGEYTSDKYKKYQKNRTEEYSKKWDESVRRYIAANFDEKDRKAVYENYMKNGGKKDRAKYAKTVADAMTRGMIKGDSEAEIEKIANEHQAGILKSKDLTAEDYLKLQNASRIGGKQGNKALGKDLAEKVGSRTALSASKNTASKISTGVMQGAAYGDVIHGGVGTYNKDARGALKETKDSNAYMGGYMGGFMGGFMLSGASSLGRVAGKEAATAGNAIANIARKAAGRNARQLAEEGTESASRVFLRNRLGELIAESPVNVSDALKMSKDENGKVNKAEFLTYLGLNTGLTGAMGGAMEGIGMALTKKNATRMAELLGKKKAGGLSEAEGVELDKLAKKITDLHEYSAGSHLEDVKAVRGEAEAKAIADNIVASAAREGIAHDALDAAEAKDYLKLKAAKQVKGAKGLTEAENARLKELQDKVTTERVKFEKTLDTVVKDTTEHLQTKATTSTADVARTISASTYYRSVGDIAKAREAEGVLREAYKGVQKDLDEISKSSGVKYIAATSDEINQKLLEAGKVGKFGELDNGILIPGKDGKKAIYVNMQSEDAYRVVIGHETTHLLSKSGNFGALKNAVRELGTKMGDYDRLFAEYSELYADEIKGMSKEEARDYIEEEVTAQLVGKYLFNDSSKDFIKSLTKDENVFRQVYDYIVDALKRAIGDGDAPKTEEAKMLQAAKDEFEKAYKEVGGNPESLKDKAKLSMAGKKAKGADKNAREFAESLHKLGLNNESIHRITGWRVDTDGEAKFEFSDKGMKLKFTMKELRGGTKAEKEKAEAALNDAYDAMYDAIRNGTEKEAEIAKDKYTRTYEQYRKVSGGRFKSGTTLGQILDHKELFKYYPDAKNIPVQFRPQEAMGNLAAMYRVTSDGEEIVLKENAKKADLESSLLHEIQHAIQEREGFASGTTPDEWSRINSRLIQRVVETLDELPREEARALVSAGDPTNVMRRKAVDVIRRTLGEDRAREYEKWLDALDLLADEYKTTNNAYWHTKGEWEARQTQARRKMSQEELDVTPREVDEKELRLEDYKRITRPEAYAMDSKKAEASLEWQADNVDTPYLKSVGPEPRYSKVKETDVDPVTGRRVVDLLKEQEENGEYITVYRSLAKVNGRYYPPMSSKLNGRFVDPIRMGEWDAAVEDPSRLLRKPNGELDLSEEGHGYVDLKKANGKDVGHVAYNPYNHTSPSMLNDQFTEAFKRPELVVVECHVPKSELTSKYQPKYAKDPVGYIDWHSGPVTAKLPGTRNVLLSRWVKPVREVPPDEIASSIKGMFDDAGVELEMPYNRVTPQVRQGLEKLGVKIAESDSSKYPKEPPEILRPLKERQFDVIQETNPADGTLSDHTWIRSADDIKSFGEAVDDPEYKGETEFAPDFTKADAEEALSTGKIRVYSSQKIENGVFVTPSEMIARDYNGGKKPRSRIVNLNEVAWIDPTEGQMAKPEGEIKFSKSSSDIRPETVTNGKGKVTREANDAYLKAAESGDIETAQRYVDAVLEARGYTVDAFHGTDTFGFTKFDFKKMFGIDKKNEFLNIFTTKSEDVAGSYTKNQRVRGISEPPKTMEERFRGSDEFASLNKALRKHGARINFDPMLRGDVDTSAQDLLGEALNKAGFKRRIKKPSYDVEYIRKEFGETDVINADEYSKMLTDALNLDAIKGTPVETGGIYKAKLKMENPLVVECNGSAWDKINNGFKGIAGESTDGVSNTREVVKWAKEHNYDSVEFRQIKDLGKYGVKDPNNITTDIYVVFNSNQFKSADAITRDKKGEIIPLKKRGSTSDDIRFSKSTVDSTGTELSESQQKYFEKSKARDDNGNLARVYHSTDTGGFTRFDPAKSDDGRTLFFSDNNTVSRSYATMARDFDPYSSPEKISNVYDLPALDDYPEKEIASGISSIKVTDKRSGKVIASGDDFVSVALSVAERLSKDGLDDEAEIADMISNPSFETAHELFASSGEYDFKYSMDYRGPRAGGDEAMVYSLYLNIERPLTINGEGRAWNDLPLGEHESDFNKWLKGKKGNTDQVVNTRAVAEYAKDKGYDGVIYKDIMDNGGVNIGSDSPSTIYAVFNSNQVKDVRNLNPTEDKDIRFSKSKRQKKKDAKRAAEYSEEKANPEILESATADKASAEERLASLTAERDKLAKRQKNIAKYGKQEGKAEKLKTIREDIAGLDEQIATANKEIEKAQKSIDDFARNESAKPKTRKEQTAEKLTAEIEGFKEDIKPIKAEIREKRAELAKLDEVDYSKMPKKEMEAHLAERNALSREINSLQKRIRDLNGEIGSRQKIISKNADNRIKAQKVEAKPVKAPKVKEPKAEAQIRERSEVVGDMRKLAEDLEAGKINEREFFKRMDSYQKELDVIESGKAPTAKPVKAPKEAPKEEPDTSFRETEDFDKYMQSRFKSARLKDFTNRAIDYGVDVSDRVKEFNSLDKEIAALTAKRKNSHTPAHIKDYTEGIEKAEARQTEIAQSVYRDFREAQHRRYANEDVARKEWTPETVSTETESIRTATENIGGVKYFADEVKKVVPKKGSDGKRANKVVTEEMKNPESCLKNYLDGEAAKDRRLQDARASALLENISERLKADPDDTRAMSDLMKVVDKMSEDSTLPTNVRNSAKTLAVATPKGRVGVALRAVDDLNKRYGDRIDGVLKLTDDELEKLATTEPGKELDELYESITNRLWGHIPATFVEKFNEVRHMFMLANIRTHARNYVGNITLRGVRRIADDIEIQLQNKVFREAIEKRGGEVDRVKVRGEEIRANKEYLEAEWEEAYKNSDSVSRWIETNRPDGVPVVKLKALNWMIQKDYKALELEDMLTFKPAFKKSYVQYVKAKDAVAQKIIAEGGTAERWDIKNLTEAQKKMARDRAMFDAEYATFRDTCLISERLTGIKHTLATKEGKTLLGTGMYRMGNMAMEGVLPFVKTPVNIFRRSIDFSPAKLLWSVGEITSKDPETFKQGIRDISTGLTGTGVFLLGFLLAETGGISIDTKLGGHSGSKYYDQDMGYQNYSVVINAGGWHQSWTIDWLQPTQSSLFMGAAFRQFREELRDGDLDFGTNAIAGLFAATSPMFDASFMSGAKDAMEMLMMRSSKETAEGESNMPAAIVQMLAGDLPKNYLSSIVPQAVSQVANLKDDVQRDTRSTFEDPLLASWDSAAKQIVSRVPVLREYWLNPKLDRRGDDKVTGGNIATRIFNTLINPSTVKEINEDKYDRELIRLRGTLEPGSWQYKNFYYPFTGNPDYDLANGKRMTYDQLYEYGKANRKEMTMDIRHMMDSPSYKYKAMSDEMRTDEINAIYDIGKMAGDYSLGVNYALKAMRKSTESRDKGDTKIFDTYKENAGGAVDKKKFWQWRMDKERAMARAHSDTDDTYRMKGLFAIASGDDNLVDAVDLEGQKEPELRKYWKAVKKEAQKAGKKARILAFEEMTDAGCKIMSNVADAGLDTANLGIKSVAAGKVANDDKQISERVYRAYGHFWNSAQAGGGLRLKYNDKNDKYSVKNIDKYERELKKRLDDVPEGATKKDVVMDFIENDLGVTNKDEAACLYQVLYIKGYGNPANKAHWKNPYKEVIDDHLKWGENQDEVYSGSGKGGWGHRRRGGWGHGGWGHGGGGSGGSGGGIGAMLPDAPKAVKASKNYGELPKANFSQAKGTKAKVTDTYAGSSDFTKPSNLNDAYRKRAKKAREALRKKH